MGGYSTTNPPPASLSDKQQMDMQTGAFVPPVDPAELAQSKARQAAIAAANQMEAARQNRAADYSMKHPGEGFNDQSLKAPAKPAGERYSRDSSAGQFTGVGKKPLTREDEIEQALRQHE
jgi:hypothetical protein